MTQDTSWHELTTEPRVRLRAQLAVYTPHRFALGIHGFVTGKCYHPRGDCADCHNEMVERQLLGGVRVLHSPAPINGISAVDVDGDRYLFFTTP